LNEQKEKKEAKKWLCQHGPNGKCPHCVDDSSILNIKHISFDEFLHQSKEKCKG
jgi:nuclear protein localization family protein 4